VTTIARAFVAVEPPPGVLAALHERVEAARRASAGLDVRWGRSGWHATLCFLGRVDVAEPVIEALAEALHDAEPVTARLGGAGAFPRARHGTVLWIGFDEGGDALAALAARVAGVLAPLGFEAEDRRFRAHVTVARSPRARDLRAAVAALGGDPIGARWVVDHAVLLASETRAEGARYTEVSRFPFRTP
jgi:2'-5' RNA ligase